MTQAVTPSDFLPRKVIEMSESERKALPAIEWDPFTAPQYQHLRSKDAVGEWTIGHPPKNDPVDISYAAPMDEGEAYEDVFDKMQALKKRDVYVGHIEWMAENQKISPVEIGYAVDQEYAKAFIDLARRHSSEKSFETILEEGGFKFDYDLGARAPGSPNRLVYRKDDEKGGSFTVFYTVDQSVHLVHEKKNANGWENLFRFSLYSESQDGFMRPHPISPEIASPLSAACAMAVQMSNDWRPKYRASPKKRASP